MAGEVLRRFAVQHSVKEINNHDTKFSCFTGRKGRDRGPALGLLLLLLSGLREYFG